VPCPHSDNPSTLVILHDALMAAATGDKVRMTTASKVAPGALQHTAALLWPGLEQQRVAARREQLLDVLQVGSRGAAEKQGVAQWPQGGGEQLPVVRRIHAGQACGKPINLVHSRSYCCN
jgi:hypothetical protein